MKKKVNSHFLKIIKVTRQVLLHRRLTHLKGRYLIEGLHEVWIFHTEKSSNIEESLAEGNLIASFHLIGITFHYNGLTAKWITEVIVTYREPRASQEALVVKNLPANARGIRDMGLVLGLGRSPGGGHGSPLQYSCLENPEAT